VQICQENSQLLVCFNITLWHRYCVSISHIYFIIVFQNYILTMLIVFKNYIVNCSIVIVCQRYIFNCYCNSILHCKWWLCCCFSSILGLHSELLLCLDLQHFERSEEDTQRHLLASPVGTIWRVYRRFIVIWSSAIRNHVVWLSVYHAAEICFMGRMGQGGLSTFC